MTDIAVATDEATGLTRLSFRAMGTDVELIGMELDSDVLAAGRAVIDDLERHWSRFLPGSDLSRLNRAAGAPVVLPLVTVDLVAEAIAWSQRTDGWFDPTVLPALEAAGYDRSFELIAATSDPGSDGPGTTAPAVPGTGDVLVQRDIGLVQLAPGVRLDLGGIGKGRAADMVAEMWARAGHAGCVSLGGDLRAVGRGPDGAWAFAVDDPFDPSATVATIGIVDGAVATSSTTRRTWTHGGERRHHLIDPRTGRPSTRTEGSVTVVAGTAVEAEVWAKTALLAGPGEGGALLRAAGVAALVVDEHGASPLNGMDAYLW